MAVRKDSIQISVEIEAAEGVKTFQGLSDRARKATDEMRKLKKAGKENTDEFKKLEAELAQVNKEFAKLGGAGATMGQLEGRAKKLNREKKSLAKNTKEYIRVTKELKQVNDRLATMRAETRGVAEGLDEMRLLGVKMPQWVNKMSLAFKGFVALEVISLFVRGAQATNQMTQEVIKLQRGVAQMTGASGDQLDDFTSRINAISETFGKENDQVLRSANALSKQMKIDFSEALDLIEEGFLAGADANGQFLDSLEEYPATVKNVIKDSETLISVLAQGVQEGTYLDKSIDSLKEFELRIREMPKSTADALQAIGLDSVKVKEVIEERGIGAAFELVQEKIRDVRDDSTEAGVVLADIFGSPGEEVGIDFIRNLDLTSDALQNLIDKGGEHVELLGEQLEANKELEEAQTAVANTFSGASSSLQIYTARAKTFLLNAAVSILDFFEQLPATAKGLQSAFEAVGNNISVFFSRMSISIAIAIKKARKAIAIRGTVRRELDGEIEDLQAARAKIASTSESIGKAYRKSFLEGMEKVRARQSVNESLLQNANQEFRSSGTKDGEDYADSFTKAAKKKIKEEPPIPEEIIEDFEIADEDIEIFTDKLFATEESKLKNFYLRGLMNQAEYEEERFNLEIRSYGRRLEALREKYGEDSEQFVSFQNKKLAALEEYNLKAEAADKKSKKQRQETLTAFVQQGGQIANAYFDLRLGLINDEIKALKDKEQKQGALSRAEEQQLKNAAKKQKRIQIQQTIVSGIVEIQKIFESFASLGPVGQILAVGKGIEAGIRTTTAVNAIKSKSFYGGGHTGNEGLLQDNQGREIVGGVHADEWVAPSWQVNHPEYGKMIDFLEVARQRNFNEGGFTSTPSRSVFQGAVQQTQTADFTEQRRLAEMQIKEARMTRQAIENLKLIVTSGQIEDVLSESNRIDLKSGF